jgi:hypothetical protein
MSGRQATESDEAQPITVPEGVDPTWQEKIDQAKAARDLMTHLRKGKPKSFRRAVGRT